jgi:glutathione S-transferase
LCDHDYKIKNDMIMKILHHLEESRSFRILWALEELGLDYRVQFYKRLANLSAPPELKKIHPLGKAPIFQDEEQCMAESAAILEYLQEQYDIKNQFKPQRGQARHKYHYWLHYAEGSLMPLLVMQLVMTQVPKHTPFFVRPVAKKISEGVKKNFIGERLADHIAYLEQYLSQHDFLVDEFSFADIQMSFPLQALQQRTQQVYPHISAYLQRLKARPAFFRALSKEQNLVCDYSSAGGQ